MIGQQHDDRAVAKRRRIQRAQQPPDLRVHEGYGGVITLNRRDFLRVGHLQLPRPVRQRGDGNIGSVGGRIRRRLDRLRRVHLEIRGRGDEGRVWAIVADRQEKGLPRALRMMRLEQIDGCVRDLCVGMPRPVAGDAQPGQCRADRRFRVDCIDLGTVVHIDAPGISPLVPGLRVVVPVGADMPGYVLVENLAHPRREIPVPGEEFRQRNHVRDEIAKVRTIAEDASLLRIKAGQETGSARRTNRVLCVGSVKPDAFRGQLIDGGRLHQPMPVGPEIGVEIVHGYEQDIGPFLGWRRICNHQ